MIVATEVFGDSCQSITPDKHIDMLNKASSTIDRTASLVLAKPFIHTLQEAEIQLEEKLKLAINAPDFQGKVAQVFRDFLVYVYTHKDSSTCKRFFFDNPEIFPTFEEAKKDADGGGVYIGKLQQCLHLKFGTSLTNCNNRKEKQDLKESWMFCTLAEALEIVPSIFIDRLEEIDIPSLRPDSSNAVTKRQYCATLLIEGTLASTRPTTTNNIGDRMLHVPPPSAQEINNPHIPQSLTDEISDEGAYLKPSDKGHVVTSWATFPSNMYSLRDGSLDLPELFRFANDALLQHNLPEGTDFLTLFLYKGIFGQAFHGFTDCVKISPWITRVIKVVKKMIDIISEGDVLQQYEQHGTVDDETKSKLEECLAGMIEFAKDNKEYEPASLEEVASGCVEVLEDLTKKLPLDTVIYIETSTYEALKHYKSKFYKKFFKGYKSVEVLKDNRLKFMKHKSQERHRFAVVGTPFVAYTIPKAATLEARGTSLQSQNALLKVLISLDLADKDEAEKIQRRNESFFNFMDWSSNDGDAGEGTIQLALNLHLPSGMCRGHLPAGFSCFQRLLPLSFRTLLLFRLMMGPLLLNLLLDSRGGKLGPKTCLPIEVNGHSCKGALAIGRFAATPCTCKQGGALMCMFKAQDQTDPLFGHILCNNCLTASNHRLKTITAEAKSVGLDTNQITKRQSQISAIIDTFTKDTTLVPTVEAMKHVMQQNGLSVSDDNLIKLLTQWAQPQNSLNDATEELRAQVQDNTILEDLDLITSNNDTGYRGVKKVSRASGPCRYTVYFKEISLGTFDTLEEAAREYAKAHYIYQKKLAAAQQVTFQIQVPHGLQAGQQLQVTHPKTSKTLFIDVPPGVAPGEKFSVTVGGLGGEAVVRKAARDQSTATKKRKSVEEEVETVPTKPCSSCGLLKKKNFKPCKRQNEDTAIVQQTSKRQKVETVPKPKPPKKVLTYYSNEVRNSIKNANPTASTKEINKIISDNFDALNAEERAPYHAKFTAEQERYEREMAEYSSKVGQQVSGNEGRWTEEEHEAFLSGLQLFGKEWKKVAAYIKTRTVAQTWTHAQKYFAKIQNAKSLKHDKTGVV